MQPAPERPRAVRDAEATWDGRVWRFRDYWYDEGTADKAIAFFREHLVLTEGRWAGKPFILEPWQEHDIVRPLFGWKRADGTRRYRRGFVWVPRKNGKTELAAGVSLLMLLGDGEPAGQVFSIAREKDQAALVFNKAVAMVNRSAALSRELTPLKNVLYCGALNASFRPLSGTPAGKHGLSMSGLIGDEIHEWRNGDLYTFIRQSSGARRQPLELLISTAGVSGSYGEQVYRDCEAILNGDIDEPETLVVIYAAGPDDDWKDPKTWAKANPNLGVTIRLEDLEAECRSAQQKPREEGEFRRYKLNQWTDQQVLWLPIDAQDDSGRRFGWDHCTGPTPWNELEPLLAGKRCFGGLDLSATQDLSALVWWFPVQEGLETPAVLARFWKPRDLLKSHSKRDRLPYEQWVESGALLTTDGNVIDHSAIREQVYRDAETFKLAYQGQHKREADEGGLAVDRWDGTETLVRLAEEGLPVVRFGQGFVSMSGPAKELERLVIANGFHHGGHPVLARHARAVAIQTDPAGNIKPAKDKSSQRIDGIVGLVMALGVAAKDRRDSMMLTASDALVVI